MGMGNRFRDVMAQVNAAAQQHQDQYLATAGQQPIPGLTGPTNSGASVLPVGMAPPNPQIQGPAPQPFMASGPYGQQAMQLAGLLGGGMQMPQQPISGMQAQGLLGGAVKGMRVPFYRPPGK